MQNHSNESTQPVKKKPRRRKQRSSYALSKTTKWVVIIFSLFLAGILGLVVGFSVFGDGNTAEVFNLKMWKHIYDLVFKT